jgi:lysophospholipase L1-like esterase
MHVRPTRFYSWILASFVVAAVGCNNGTSGSSSGQTGGSGSGGVVAAGGRAGAGSGGVAITGGSVGGGVGGEADGGRASGGTGGSAGARSGGVSGATGGQTGGVTATGGLASGGAASTGGQGSGGKNTGGSAGTNAGGGGTATGGRATGGAGESGGSPGSGGNATGGATGTGGKTGADAGTDYHPCPTDGTACRLMPFGDSITDGFNGDTPGGYRVELFRRAHAAGKNITFVGSGWNGPDTVDGAPFPHNHEGHSGWTIDPTPSRSGISTLLKNDGGSESVMVKFAPHIVLLMIGTNDAIDNYDMANAPARLGKLIDTIYDQLPNVLIVVAQPIPSRGDPSKGDDTGLSARIKTYDETIPTVVKTRADAGKHILVVDMFTPFDPNKTSLLEDQWHPNLQGYVLLGTQWYSVLQSLL